jgi:hypothetical protein
MSHTLVADPLSNPGAATTRRGSEDAVGIYSEVPRLECGIAIGRVFLLFYGVFRIRVKFIMTVCWLRREDDDLNAALRSERQPGMLRWAY